MPVGRPYRPRLVPICSPLRCAVARRASLGPTDYGRRCAPANGNRRRNLRWAARSGARPVAAGMVAAGMRDSRGRIAIALRRARSSRSRLRRRAAGRGRALRAVRPRRHRRLVPGQAAHRRARDALARGREHGRPRGARSGGDRGDRSGRWTGRRRSAFGQATDDPSLAASARADLDRRRGPGGRRLGLHEHVGGRAARRGRARTVEWKLTAMRPGDYTVDLAARARARRRRRARRRATPRASSTVTISDEPVPARVNEEGEVVRGEEAGARRASRGLRRYQGDPAPRRTRRARAGASAAPPPRRRGRS